MSGAVSGEQHFPADSGLFDLPVASLLGRLNQIAATSLSLDALLLRTLGLAMEECQAKTGALYLLEVAGNHLVLRARRGAEGRSAALGQRLHMGEDPLGLASSQRQPVSLRRDEGGFTGVGGWDELSQSAQDSLYCLPLLLPERVVGVVQLIDPARLQPELLRLAAERMVTEIDKAEALEAYQHERQRKERLITILGQIGATLDSDEILRLLIDYGRQVINAEACSLFLVDEEQGDYLLHLSTNTDQYPILENMRVPKGKGIIGDVVENGKTVLVSDVSHDPLHFRGVDQSSGFVTKAILAVPLRAAAFNQGTRGLSQERIVGGLQALNKLEGTFDEEDARLLTTLAQQAATVYRMAKGVEENNQLSNDMIEWMVAAMDARDPYTEGHSTRVRDYSVEIARNLALSPDMVELVRIGSLLHDIGKIGIDDAILRKPGRLSDEEFNAMKQHPVIGARMMSKVRNLHNVLPALAQHHERLDGTGYPNQLQGEQIHLFGRIVAVADVFDAITSKRPYRDGVPAEEALDYLYNRVNTEFDASCVDALTRAFMSGVIKTQRERELQGMD